MGEFYASIGYKFRRTGCDKKCYSERIEAVEVAAKHRHELVCFEGMGEYWCRDHGSWHVGHAHKYQPNTVQFQENLKWFRSLMRRN